MITPFTWTCGPVYRHPKTGVWHCTVMSNGRIVAKVDGPTEQECQDNSRIIAAAPKLLAALEKCADIAIGDKLDDKTYDNSLRLIATKAILNAG